MRLSQLCARQPCTFRVDYKLDNVPGREFGSVFLTPQNENLALSVVAAGWAKARVLLPQAQTTLLKGCVCLSMRRCGCNLHEVPESVAGQAEPLPASADLRPASAQVRVSGEGQARSPYYADLEAAQQAAEAKELGLWTKARARRSCLTQ